MQLLSIISIIISVISVFITGLIYMNAKESVKNTKAALNYTKETLKQSQDKYLYELRLNALKATKEVEMIWQSAISDVYHEKERIRKFEGELNLTIKKMFDDYELGLLKPSLENISKMRNKLSEEFDSTTEGEAKLAIREMEIVKISLRQTQEESVRKFELLYNKLKENQR